MSENKINILMVDDLPENLLALEALLEPFGQNLFKAQSGREALRQVLDRDFALILLDVQMPEMDGYETAEAIRGREKSRNAPIIFVTASHPSETMLFKGYETGAVDFLFKPLNPDILRSKVGVFIELAKQTEEERRLNSLLIQQTEQLAASNKDLQAFAHTVSHDLKAPLRAITNFSQILLDEHGTNLDAAGREHLSRIITAGKRMGNLIEDLITLSRITHRPLNRQPVNLADLARGVLADLGQGMQERKVEALIPENIPASADPNLARVALDNLIGNAWKYTGKAEHPRIEMGFEEKPGEPRTYFVRDNGAGFDMDHAEKLFMPFQRYHRTSEFEGTGIGLATVHRIIERHGGAIRAESRVGVGSAFYFTLEPAHKTPEIFRERQI